MQNSKQTLSESDEKQRQQESSIGKLAAVLKNSKMTVFEYLMEDDRLIEYGEGMQIVQDHPDYVTGDSSHFNVHPADKKKLKSFLSGMIGGPIEIRMIGENDRISSFVLEGTIEESREYGQKVLVGSRKDITQEKQREAILEEQAHRDSLTMLYNHSTGKRMIEEYLQHKTPYTSCGLMVIDIDYFKNVNDTYGHLFGDTVLIALAHLLERLFSQKDIVMRAGGDEFAVFLEDITHSILVRKAMELVESVRRLTFDNTDYCLTCSVGVCFLPENAGGYTYSQVFKNADWALYQAKKKGRNRYVFCDDLQRYVHTQEDVQQWRSGAEEERTPDGEHCETEVDARYLQNDIVASAFEIFEKTGSFQLAVELLLEVIGLRYHLDRITVIQTSVRGKKVSSQFQWRSAGTPKVLEQSGAFTKEDFLTLFQSYDENGTTVLQYDDMEAYSEQGRELLMQGNAKTVLYAAMYCEGQYTGAISFVSCRQKQYWSEQSRCQLGEVTKLISAHLAKNQAMNGVGSSVLAAEYDSLTGLISFGRFKEEIERIIVGGYATSHAVIYSDFENFKYFNRRYGYSEGDQLLRAFCSYIMENLDENADVYFTRVVADQFITFLPCENVPQLLCNVKRMNQEFVTEWSGRYPEVSLWIRSGVYQIDPECAGASYAIDAADYARKQVRGRMEPSVIQYVKELEQQQNLENEIINGMTAAMQKEEFKVYLQPRFSLEDYTMTGAEALVRWHRPDGTILYPNEFLPYYERNGRIVELDFYVFERVAAFLAECRKQGITSVPVSINASVLHANHEDAVQRYLEILQKYQIDPAMTEIELTETEMVSVYDNVRRMFERLQQVHMMTSLDDFGAGYSLLNTVFEIPVNTVKLDRRFIMNCCKSSRGLYFLKQMIELVKGLGYHVVGAGVETEQEAEILKGVGCEEALGFWFASPIPISEFLEQMHQMNSSIHSGIDL